MKTRLRLCDFMTNCSLLRHNCLLHCGCEVGPSHLECWLPSHDIHQEET